MEIFQIEINLEMLNFFHNNIGVLPKILSNFSKELNFLGFGWNLVRRSIPTRIENLTNLEKLFFDANQLTGPIPSTIGKLQKLYHLGLLGTN